MSTLRPEDEESVRRFSAWKHRPKRSAASAGGEVSPQQSYDELMKSAFGPALREAGLRGSGGRFELPSQTHWAQIGFQKSAYSDGQEVRFTVNVSVIARDEWARQAAAKPYLGQRPAPTVQYGPWAEQVRLGILTPAAEDKWWRIVRDGDTTGVRNDVLHDLLTYAVPWLRERVG